MSHMQFAFPHRTRISNVTCFVYEEINRKKREMHRNIRRRVSTSRMRYVHDYWMPFGNEVRWDSVNVCSRITDFFYCKRRYVSDQAWNVEAMQIGGTINMETALGMFRVLPRELLHSLFDRISVKQLLSITLTSSIFNSEVQRYLLLENARRKFLAETTAYMEENIIDFDPFYSWGMLLKASTIVMDSRKRCSFLASFFSKNEMITNWPGWGRCFMAFCEKWDFHECETLMHAILHFTDLNQLLYEILPEEVGKYPSLEMEIRLRLRGLFMSHSTKDERDYGFWISAILRTQETTELQGKLFMIMFGPVKITESRREIIDWEVLCDGSVNLQHIYMRLLGPIALSFHHLENTSSLECYAWTDDQIFTLLEQISSVPNAWALHTSAALLALHPRIMHIALLKRLSEGRTNEAAYLFHAIKAVLHRWGIFVSGAISDAMLKTFRALPTIHRRLFLGSLLRAESYQLSGLLLSTPFNAESFHAELSSARSISTLMALLAKNV